MCCRRMRRFLPIPIGRAPDEPAFPPGHDPCPPQGGPAGRSGQSRLHRHPHWGDASVLENNWSGKRGKALKSVLALLCKIPIRESSLMPMPRCAMARSLSACWSLWISGRRASLSSASSSTRDSPPTRISSNSTVTASSSSPSAPEQEAHCRSRRLAPEKWQEIRIRNSEAKYTTVRVTIRWWSSLRQTSLPAAGYDRTRRENPPSSSPTTGSRSRPSGEPVRRRWLVEKGSLSKSSSFTSQTLLFHCRQGRFRFDPHHHRSQTLRATALMLGAMSGRHPKA